MSGQCQTAWSYTCQFLQTVCAESYYNWTGHRALCLAKLAYVYKGAHIGFKVYRTTRLNGLYRSVINDILKHFLARFLLNPDHPCSGHKYSDLEVPAVNSQHSRSSGLSTWPGSHLMTVPREYKSPALLSQYGRSSGMGWGLWLACIHISTFPSA